MEYKLKLELTTVKINVLTFFPLLLPQISMLLHVKMQKTWILDILETGKQVHLG